MAITDLIPVPAGINAGVASAKQSTMLTLLGNPRGWYDQECREVTNARLAALVVTERVRSFRVRGLRPAVASLADVVADIASEVPDVFAALGHVGMLCVRNVRGSATAISNHSWGTAIDLTLNGILDKRGDDRVQEGLTRIAPIFNRRGWFWGAGFRTEDAMHFECGDALVRKWHADGLFGEAGPVPPVALSLGDRGPEVVRLQERLNAAGADLVVDGDFGRGTHAALMAFQAENGLTADGVAGPRTMQALGIA